MLLYFEQGEKSYEEEIARIRNPDGSWSTHEQCLEQKELTLTYLDEYKEAEAEVNAQTDYESCTAEEKRDILNTLERLIIEMESDAYTWYSCD
jgi:hypothetical protein